MKRALQFITIIVLVGIAVAIYAASPYTPPSRRYYEGPVSSHFDGQRFFNPEGEKGTGGAQKDGVLAFFRIAAGYGPPHAAWPAYVPVVQSVPPRRVEGGAMRVTWVGHATTLVQTQGLNILIDPVWAERDSPVQWVGPKRVREPGIALDKLPPIDIVLISHNHYDHMDMATLSFLEQRDHPRIFTGLGNDKLLASYGISATAGDWGQRFPLRPGIAIVLTRAHHWSARWIDDYDRSLWVGFRILLPGGDIYYTGDTGEGDGKWLTEAQARAPTPVRFAILPIGPYKVGAPQTGNHIGPRDAVVAFRQLGAACALGVHWGTFKLGSETIDGPPAELRAALKAARIDAARFRTLQPGQSWDIPPLTDQSSSITSASTARQSLASCIDRAGDQPKSGSGKSTLSLNGISRVIDTAP
jgi:L-ascorbate metabolism protein UlaG (beta-lactamase superfamily)